MQSEHQPAPTSAGTVNSQVQLVHATPDGDKLVAYMARVSNPANQESDSIDGLLRYCIRNAHWSIFEMVGACVEINTTRDIARQILRHRSFHFQEFSQRYADASLLGEMVARECRMQDDKNRQNSIPTSDKWLQEEWAEAQADAWGKAAAQYRWALAQGIAKEQARALLPEGLTPSRMYMHGTLRDWIHYLAVRTDPSTQKEHRLIASQIGAVLAGAFPVTMTATGVAS